jgi:hypothetical protein
LPCVHTHWYNSRTRTYRDPFIAFEKMPSQARIEEFVAAIANGGKVIMAKTREVRRDSEGKEIAVVRGEYVGIFKVDEVAYSPNGGLHFRVIDRL